MTCVKLYSCKFLTCFDICVYTRIIKINIHSKILHKNPFKQVENKYSSSEEDTQYYSLVVAAV